MIEVSIENIEQFTQYIDTSFEYGTLYRGVSDIDKHKLVPSLWRYLDEFINAGLSLEDLYRKESDYLRILKEEIRYHENLFPDDDWQLLVIAQHHGLPTRLLDWSYNALTALFFAVNDQFNGDSAVYALPWKDNFLSIADKKNKHPFEISDVKAFLPPHISPRIRAQSGLFTIHPNPSVLFSPPDLVRIRIAASGRTKLKLALNNFGINQKTMFPDVDGLCGWIKWMKFGSLKH